MINKAFLDFSNNNNGAGKYWLQESKRERKFEIFLILFLILNFNIYIKRKYFFLFCYFINYVERFVKQYNKKNVSKFFRNLQLVEM